jgi:hypothetical protein
VHLEWEISHYIMLWVALGSSFPWGYPLEWGSIWWFLNTRITTPIFSSSISWQVIMHLTPQGCKIYGYHAFQDVAPNVGTFRGNQALNLEDIMYATCYIAPNKWICLNLSFWAWIFIHMFWEYSRFLQKSMGAQVSAHGFHDAEGDRQPNFNHTIHTI